MTIRQKNLPIAALERIDDLCASFERKWQTGEPPAIESMLTEDFEPIQREVLLAELISLDVDYRRRRGEKPTKEQYLDRFPDDAHVINETLDEGDKRPAAFEPPSVARLAELFPAIEIIELIGVGGMGAVYQARQSGLDRLVALKILPEEFAHDIKFALRFTREARTLAKLNHPNIVSVYEFGKVENTYYFLMEFVDGSTLRDVVRSSQLSPEHALAIVPHLCDALQYAHDQGVIHRDIKPENILIAADGSIKIADFGLSRILGKESENQSLTATHQVLGTPRYMAPEQLEGAHGVDHRADIYSLGVVFYEMLTGELPIGKFEVPSRKAEIDVRLDEVVLRTLEKEPRRRYQRASQVKSDVQSIASTRSTDSALAPTVVYDGSPQANGPTSTTTLADQELAGRMLLTRRQLMERVEACLKPLFRGQVLQILVGVGLIVLGAQCWARNTQVPGRLLNGLILHAYGIAVIVQSALVCSRIRKIDYAKSLDDIRGKLDSLRSGYQRSAVIIGFAWWLMWIPVAVCLGFDMVLLPQALWVSLIVGLLGFGISCWFYYRAHNAANASDDFRKSKLSGEGIASAYLALEEIEKAQIS